MEGSFEHFSSNTLTYIAMRRLRKVLKAGFYYISQKSCAVLLHQSNATEEPICCIRGLQYKDLLCQRAFFLTVSAVVVRFSSVTSSSSSPMQYSWPSL